MKSMGRTPGGSGCKEAKGGGGSATSEETEKPREEKTADNVNGFSWFCLVFFGFSAVSSFHHIVGG